MGLGIAILERAGTQDEVVTIGADDSVDEALPTMTTPKLRRLR